MLNIINVSPVLARMHKSGKLKRKEIIGSPCKWEYSKEEICKENTEPIKNE